MSGDIYACRCPVFAKDTAQNTAPFAGGDAGVGAADGGGHDVFTTGGGAPEINECGFHLCRTAR